MLDQSSNRPLTSKAVTYKSLGGYEVIEYVERTVRAPATGEVRIELLRNMVAAGEIKLRVVEEYAPTRVADAQRALVAGSPRGRPVILF